MTKEEIGCETGSHMILDYVTIRDPFKLRQEPQKLPKVYEFVCSISVYN